ncbi:MAG: hypothetical protein ACYC64_13520 [Armatimonadota bacterium]
MKYTVSLLTNSTTLSIPEIAHEFGELTRDVELFVARDADMRDMELNYSDALSLSQIVAGWYPGSTEATRMAELIDEARLFDLKPRGLATFFPEICSADLNLYRAAKKAILNTLHIANSKRISVVQIVAGKLTELCRREDGNCGAVMFDASNPERWRNKKIDWLVEAFKELHSEVKGWGDARLEDLAIAISIQPGLLYTLSGAGHVREVLDRTKTLKLRRLHGRHKGKPYHFVNFSADFGHLRLIGQGIEPPCFWHELFGSHRASRQSCTAPRERVANVRISGHPLNLVHCDIVPPFHEMDSRQLRAYARGEAKDVGGITRWLNCFACLAESGDCIPAPGLNASLQLEAEDRVDRVRDGLTRSLDAIRETFDLRREYPTELSGLCTGFLAGREIKCPLRQ